MTADVGLDRAVFYTHGVAVADYDRDGESAQRQIGKVQELALGFLGGPGAPIQSAHCMKRYETR